MIDLEHKHPRISRRSLVNGTEDLLRIAVAPVVQDLLHEIAVTGWQRIREEVPRLEEESVGCRPRSRLDDMREIE
jgi:hypothetical protein